MQGRFSMAIKPIRSASDHNAALREIERLWGAPQGTPKGDRLDVLLALVESYERAHYPVAPPDPIAAIRFRLEQAGLGFGALIGVIGSRSRVYEVLRGDQTLDAAHDSAPTRSLRHSGPSVDQASGEKRRRAA